jgi:hypothetical protein
MGSNVRGEPAGITVADVMILVVGVAAGLVVEPVRAETTRVVQVCGFAAPVTTHTSAFWTLARFALPVALGLALAVVVRCARHARMPDKGEWLALATMLLLLDPALPGETHVGGPVTTRPMTYHERPDGARVPTRHVRPAVLVDLDPTTVPAAPAGLGTAGLGLAAALAGWVVFGQVRRGLAPWVAVLLLTALGWAWLRIPARLNPTEVVRFRYSWIGFTPVASATGPSWLAPDWYVEGRYALGRWPIGLLAVVPAVAAARGLARGSRDQRRWTGWAAVVIALALGVAWAWDELAMRSWPAPLIRASVLTSWIAALALAACLVTRTRR